RKSQCDSYIRLFAPKVKKKMHGARGIDLFRLRIGLKQANGCPASTQILTCTAVVYTMDADFDDTRSLLASCGDGGRRGADHALAAPRSAGSRGTIWPVRPARLFADVARGA